MNRDTCTGIAGCCVPITAMVGLKVSFLRAEPCAIGTTVS